MEDFKQFLERCRAWQKENPDWELICDLDGGSDQLYVQWSELSKAERMSWVGRFGSEGREAFEEFAVKKCKVECGVLDGDQRLWLHGAWPAGNAMTVFKTKENGVSLL